MSPPPSRHQPSMNAHSTVLRPATAGPCRPSPVQRSPYAAASKRPNALGGGPARRFAFAHLGCVEDLGFLAAGIWGRVLTGSNAEAGVTFFFLVLPEIAVSAVTGLVADRVRRRPLPITGDVAGAAVALLLVFVHTSRQVWLIYLVMIGYGTIGTFVSAAKRALLVNIVPAELLGEASGLLNTMAEGLRLVTPLVGAGLFTVAGGPVVAELDAPTFAMAVVAMLWIRVDEVRREPRQVH